MNQEFDKQNAKEFLIQKERKEKEKNEKERKILLKKITEILKKEFANQNVEVFLVGSITQPNKFNRKSDIDIVLKNFKGDRFDVWPRIEREIERNIEMILYEKCHFKEFIDQEGLKVV